MKGLILKDFINLKKNIKIFGVLTVLYAAMAFTSGDSSFFSSIVTMLFAVLTLSIYSYDELAKWDPYALTMPVSKDNIVQGKYIMMLLLTLIGSLFSIAISILINLAVKADSMFAGITSCGIGAAIVILFYSVTIPFITKLGVEKARLIFFAVYMIPFLLIVFADKALNAIGLTIPKNLIDMAKFISNNIYIILPITVVVALGISYVISIRIYRKREF
jgi:hypothetical protein